jgi:hypothetical protein
MRIVPKNEPLVRCRLISRDGLERVMTLPLGQAMAPEIVLPLPTDLTRMSQVELMRALLHTRTYRHAGVVRVPQTRFSQSFKQVIFREVE